MQVSAWPLPTRFRAVMRDRRGLAMTEFALAAPFVATLGLYGMELANLILANLRVSQIASNLADTASRVGESSGLSQKQVREIDINDAFEAARQQGKSRKVLENGRITLSSLEQNSSGGQWIHWQRCVGSDKTTAFASSYGKEGDGASGTAFAGMGPKKEEIKAPTASAVMFAEIAYRYQPLISDYFVGTPIIRARAAFLVREPRDLSTNNPANPSPAAVPSSCTNYGP